MAILYIKNNFEGMYMKIESLRVKKFRNLRIDGQDIGVGLM